MRYYILHLDKGGVQASYDPDDNGNESVTHECFAILTITRGKQGFQVLRHS